MTKEIDKKAVGERIKRIRLEMGFTQSEFAKAISTTIPAVSNWETGRNLPNNKRLSEVAFHGQMTVDELLNGKQETIVDAIALFSGQDDIRKYLSIDVDDDEVTWLENQFGINHDTVKTVLNAATIYVNMSLLPEEIEVIKNI